jgi:hypothetical protein
MTTETKIDSFKENLLKQYQETQETLLMLRGALAAMDQLQKEESEEEPAEKSEE